MSCVGVDRSRTITIFCCSVRPMFSVMCGLNCSLFMVVGCSCFYVVFIFIFIFYNRHLYFYLVYLISKGIFHLGGWYLKCTSAFTCYLQNGGASVFFIYWIQSWDYEYSMHTLNILSLNVNGLNSAISCALIQETHLKQSDVARFQN